MGRLDALSQKNVNVEAALGRMLGKEDLYIKLLRSFAGGTYLEEIENCFGQGDAKAAQDSAHTIKGVAANLELTDIFQITKRMEILIKDEDDFDGAKELLPSLKKHYDEIIQTINEII